MGYKHILIIDDNDVDNYISESLIIKSEIADKVTVVNSATDALLFLEGYAKEFNKFPKTIFLDLSMPIMDGFDFLDEFKIFSEDLRFDCNIYLLTSSNNMADKEKAEKYGFVKGFLIKPLKLKNLLEL